MSLIHRAQGCSFWPHSFDDVTDGIGFFLVVEISENSLGLEGIKEINDCVNCELDGSL